MVSTITFTIGLVRRKLVGKKKGREKEIDTMMIVNADVAVDVSTPLRIGSVKTVLEHLSTRQNGDRCVCVVR
jgi:hypothetical protein